jgi:microcystin-dependent protein
MGVVNTTYTFSGTDTITSLKMNNIIDDTTFTADAIIGTTLEVASGKLKIRSAGITSNELGAGSVNPSATTFADSLLPSGAVMAFAMNTSPAGWIAADGASVSTATYAALFAAIGYTYGGSGGLFNLPDLRGYFVRGSGTNSDGTVSGAFGVKQADEFESHSHGFATFAHSTSNGANNEGGTSGTFTGDTVTYLAGGTETRPKNIAMLYCIKF